MKIKDKYAIVGIGYTPQGRIEDRTALSFHVEACANAILDAGLEREDIDGLMCYRQFPPGPNEEELTPYLVAQQLGLTPKLLSQEANCARSHFYHAMGALEAGLCNYVVLSYADNSLMGRRSPVQPYSHKAVFGHLGDVGSYAMAARRGMYTLSTGPETWKEIAVAQRRWASMNPNAIMYDRPMTYDDYYKSKWVVEPLRLADCCLMNDGGRACVITSLERARDLKNPPAVIMGLGQHNPSYDIQQSITMDGPTGAKIAGQEAFKMAGITTADVDACQIYDCFTYTVEITLQDYGFFGPGEGKDWFQDGRTAPGGSLPVNTSGGQLSEAYFMGMTPITEAAMQLMGRCGQRQLGPDTGTKEPEIILCSDNGGIIQTHACIILRRN
ncbi:MAG: thiolase family protein [Deltaproteobacteria bacterium]|jgi:acetyl-CoA acetyltransferase|nr:thiolase family protein [Deltaproteobacteria bacterium]